MTILDKIVADKRKEMALKKTLIPIKELEATTLFSKETTSLVSKLRHSKSGIIAEYKRRSPSKATINQDLDVFEVAQGYENAGACGMSVLTNGKYFGGSLEDLVLARASCKLPLLRKEFTIDEYQIVEAKAYGADVILLIAAILSKEEIKTFSELAKSLKMEVLLEVHNEAELQRSLIPSLDMIGVNNRDLKTFEVHIDVSKKLSALIPNDYMKISESGISNVNSIKELKSFGYQGFLIGEAFMKTPDPEESAKSLIQTLDS